jgi:hypothetical protein
MMLMIQHQLKPNKSMRMWSNPSLCSCSAPSEALFAKSYWRVYLSWYDDIVAI